MEERILEIVFYLVQRAKDHNGRVGPYDAISQDLKSLGFTESEISSAYGWFLDEMQREGGKINPLPRSPHSVRILSPDELQNFSTESAGYLLQLLQLQLLSASQFEHIVEKSFLVAPDHIDLPMIKAIAARYVFTSGPAVDLNWFNVDDDEVVN